MFTLLTKSIIKKIYRSKIAVNITDSGISYKAYYNPKTLESFRQIAEYIINKYRQKIENRRLIVAIAGPPGSGKSTISKILYNMIREKIKNLYLVPLDGFHYTNEYLKSKTINFNNRLYTLYDLKGAHFTFDYNNFKKHIGLIISGHNIYWPLYSRKIHNPISEGIKINGNGIIIIEGNYLLLNKFPWNETCGLYDIKIFIKPYRFLLKKRIIKRKLAGGHSKKYARKHYRLTDRYNISLVLKNVCKYDILIKQCGLFKYKYIQKG